MKKRTLIALFITLALITSNLSAVFADDGAVPAPEGETQADEPAAEAPAAEEPVVQPEAEAPAAEEPVDEPEADAPVAEEPVDQSEADAPIEEKPVDQPEAPVDEEPAAQPEADAPAAEEGAAEGESLTDVVAALNENEVHIVNENGDPVSLASQEAEDMLQSKDPFFWNGTIWVGYTLDGTGCPANVQCNPSATPFQDAVAAAGAGNTVYVASGNYAEDVTIDYAGQSLIAFHDVTIPNANDSAITLNGSGYAVVQSITLNVDLAANEGVYADLVIVNEPGQTGGRLDDAMELVNDGGRIEADVQIYSTGNGVAQPNRVRDANHHEVNFEWECGEPNEIIYLNYTYSMTLMNPFDDDILAYYTTHGDERFPLLDLSAEERMEDLIIAVNVSEDEENWDHDDEELIYWYLVGNTGTDHKGDNIDLDATQQIMANEITSGVWDDVTRYWGIWFMYPNKEINSNKDVQPYNLNSNDRQLTFFVYDPRQFSVVGCMDPEAENYDPNANTTNDDACVYRMGCTDPAALNYDPEAIMDDGTCTYPSTIDTPPLFIPGPLPIPVTGETEAFIIPVTGADLLGEIAAQKQLLLTAGAALLGFSLMMGGKRKKQ